MMMMMMMCNSVHKIPSLDPIQSQLNPVHILIPSFS